MIPGLRLRQVRERLGLTYRDVERASFELAANRGRSEFILHISRLADIENRGVVPSLHKLYTLAAVYHINPLDILKWYEVPINECFGDSAAFPTPRTHVMAPPATLRIPTRFDPAFDPKRTEFLSRMVSQWGQFEGVLANGYANGNGNGNGNGQFGYGYIGVCDHRMAPLLRPGSVVLIDLTVRRIEETDWASEYDRPLYFVEVRDGYRCGWFHGNGSRLVMQPHPLSRCAPESWTVPDEAEIIGRVVGVVTRLNEPWNTLPRESQAVRADSSRKAP